MHDHLRDVIAIAALVAAALFAVFVILVNQKASLPEWLPLIGSDRFELKAEFATAQAVTPGQGQSVDIAGVRVGDVTGVDLVEGHAVVTMQVDKKYSPLIHDDASMLLRPKTGLNDMVVALDPGSHGPQLADGSTIPLSNTEPNVNPDEILAALDEDTQNFLRLLLTGGAQGLKGRGVQLSQAFRRFEPTARDLAKINGLLAQRRASVARSIHNFRLVSEELAGTDGTLAEFVDSSNAVLASLAKEQANIRSTVRELPSTLHATHGALVSNNRFSKTAAPALRRLLPSARALAPALRALQPFFRQTTAPIRDQIRPFTVQIRTPTIHLRQAAKLLGDTTPPLRDSLRLLNQLLNELAFNPSGSNEGFLFWVAWLNHNTNAAFNIEDAQGPLLRTQPLIGCKTAELARQTGLSDPFLNVAQTLTRVPVDTQIPGC